MHKVFHSKFHICKQDCTTVKVKRLYRLYSGWNEVLLFWFTGYLYIHKCKKNAKQNRLMYFEFWKHLLVPPFFLFTFWKKAIEIQNILTHSVWHFPYICNYKDSRWTKTTKPRFSQNRVSRVFLLTQLYNLVCKRISFPISTFAIIEKIVSAYVPVLWS